MGLRTTRTMALLYVSPAAYKEIHDLLKEAGYDHAFDRDGGIDMHGIAIKEERMAQNDPPDKATYERLYHQNTKIDGFGMEVRQVLACPFCCAPGWLTVWVIKNGGPEAAMREGATCGQCGRGSKAIMTRSAGGVSFEFVQTCGEDPPAYLPPMRRVDDIITKVD